MKNQLIYQTSEYDCGPTTLINAIRYLFDREQVTPELLQNIYLYTLDSYNDAGENGKSGTSAMAMHFLSCWFNQYGEKKNFPIHSRFLEGEQVTISQNSLIVECLQQGGVAAVWVWLEGEGHFVLLISEKDGQIGLFDPYYIKDYPDSDKVKVINADVINRMVAYEVMNDEEVHDYGLGRKASREAMLIYNTQLRRTPDKTIEYII